MCIFGGGGGQEESKPMTTFSPVTPRTNITANPLPKRRDVKEELGEVKDIAYGGEQTKSNPAAGKKKGSKALQIALNQPTAGANTGGISNV